MARYEMPDVVVLLPGITGSVLKKDGKTVWGFSPGTIGRALFTRGGSMRKDLALPYDDPVLPDLGDGIVADSLVADLHLLPGIWKIDGYTKVTQSIKAAFDVTEGKNFFQFPYDWRRDNRASAHRLARQSHEWLKSWRVSSGNAEAKLILVAHSMGGLVSRYFLECLEGWKVARALVTFGTPYRGSLNALDGLANGLKKGPLDLTAVARQFTALYQLLPVFECYDSGNGKLQRVGEGAGIPNVDAGMAASALAFHREIEKAVAENHKQAQYQSTRYHIYPVVGIAQETNLSAKLAGGRVEMLQTYDGKTLGGDGTVPRVSAIPIEMSNDPSGTYVATKHGSLQNADQVLVHLSGTLSGLGIDLGDFKKPDIQVALELEDAYFKGEPVDVRARPSKTDAALTATLWRSGEVAPIAKIAMQKKGGDWHAAAFAPPGAGAYRVTITGDEVETAEDAFVAAECDAGSLS